MFVFLIGCTLKEKVLMKVGSFEITQTDASLRDKIVEIYYPNHKTPNAGLIQLKNSFTYAAILENNGHIINEHKLKNEMDRIDASTKDPKTLERIKNIFKDDSGKLDIQKYQKVFILPTYAERIIGTSFFQGLSLHNQTHQKAMDFHLKVSSKPLNLIKIADESNYKNGEWCISKKEGVSFTDSKDKNKKKRKEGQSTLIDKSPVPNAQIRETIEMQWAEQNKAWVERWFSDIINPTKTGALVSQIIDFSESWMVMRLIHKKSDQACFETAIIEKVSFEKWFEEEKNKVTIIQI